MKKIILVLVLVFVTGTMANANSSSIVKPAVEMEEFGCAGDCVRSSRAGALDMQGSTELTLVETYMVLYRACLRVNCGIEE